MSQYLVLCAARKCRLIQVDANKIQHPQTLARWERDSSKVPYKEDMQDRGDLPYPKRVNFFLAKQSELTRISATKMYKRRLINGQ